MRCMALPKFLRSGGYLTSVGGHSMNKSRCMISAMPKEADSLRSFCTSQGMDIKTDRSACTPGGLQVDLSVCRLLLRQALAAGKCLKYPGNGCFIAFAGIYCFNRMYHVCMGKGLRSGSRGSCFCTKKHTVSRVSDRRHRLFPARQPARA